MPEGIEASVKVNIEKMTQDLEGLAEENRQLRIRFLQERVSGLTAQIQLAEVLRQQAEDELTILRG